MLIEVCFNCFLFACLAITKDMVQLDMERLWHPSAVFVAYCTNVRDSKYSQKSRIAVPQTSGMNTSLKLPKYELNRLWSTTLSLIAIWFHIKQLIFFYIYLCTYIYIYAATCELHKNIRRHYKRTGLNNITTQWKRLDGYLATAKYTHRPDIVKFPL